MKRLTVYLKWDETFKQKVGELADQNSKIYFEFDPDFIKLTLSFSPYHLPLLPGLHQEKKNLFYGLHGVFADSLPDGWGMLLLKRAFNRNKIDFATTSPLDWLEYLGTRTMGALTYECMDSKAVKLDTPFHNLLAIKKEIAKVVEGQAKDILQALIEAGGSPAGARPKVIIQYDGKKTITTDLKPLPGFESWIVKFQNKNDMRESGQIEYAYSLMAKAAGINMPETKLFEIGKDAFAFASKRFDRTNTSERLHMHTFGNLIHSDYRIPDQDYLNFLEVVLDLTKNHEDLLSAYRLMVFNLLTHNRDDHVKNVAFLMDQKGQWRLAPAYDLTFSEGPGGEHSMTILGEGKNPTLAHCLTLASKVGIKDSKAKLINEEVLKATKKWKTFVDMARLKKKTMQGVLCKIGGGGLA